MMYTSKSLFLVVAFLTCASGYVGSSQASLANFDPLAPTGEGCVSPQGLRDHAVENLKTFVSCGERCQLKEVRGMRSVSECQSGCKDLQYMNMILSWVQSCWNQVFSCEYQMTAIIWLQRNSLRNSISGGVPFYPPPPGAGGACSCNLGWVEGNQTTAGVGINACIPLSVGKQVGTEAADCMCCALSSALSGLSICPKSDLSFLELNAATAQEIAGKMEGIASSCAIIDNTPGDCVSKYNFTSSGVTAVNPFKLPQIGKEPLSNGPGNAFTDGSNAVVTVSIDGYSPKVMTLAAWKDAAAATGTGTAKVTGTGTQASATGTALAGKTGGSSAATATSGAGIMGASDMRWAGGAVFLLWWRMW